jgi:aspartate kinase
MQVYKFGGASIANPERMTALLPIIKDAEQPLIMVVSAYGKTTNALEDVVNNACKGKKQEAHELVKVLEQQHLDYVRGLLNDDYYAQAVKALNVFFTELQWAVDEADGNKYDYSYDQIVCIGELLSTRMFAFYLQQSGLKFEWADARDVFRTDDTYRDAKVDWEYSKAKDI